jgi:hypothetical protein
MPPVEIEVSLPNALIELIARTLQELFNAQLQSVNVEIAEPELTELYDHHHGHTYRMALGPRPPVVITLQLAIPDPSTISVASFQAKAREAALALSAKTAKMASAPGRRIMPLTPASNPEG